MSGENPFTPPGTADWKAPTPEAAGVSTDNEGVPRQETEAEEVERLVDEYDRKEMALRENETEEQTRARLAQQILDAARKIREMTGKDI